MKFYLKKQCIYALFFIQGIMLLSSPVWAEEEKEAEEEQGLATMTAEKRQSLGIHTSPVMLHKLTRLIFAPGEVTTNAYQTTQISSRISAQIITRYARLGERVKSGQKLLTLTSVEMAEAQGNLLVADREWQRVKKLGRKVVSDQRYIEAQVNRQQSYARVLAYGMTALQADKLLAQKDASKATGTFNLLSNQQGTIISDPFVNGQVVEAGKLLMEVSDDSVIWVEARVNPDLISDIATGSLAVISSGEQKYKGRVVQIHPRIDETTRTLSVRIAVENDKRLLRPGQFVKVALHTSKRNQVIAIPESAMTLLHGDQVVFMLDGDELYPQLVETGEVQSDWVEVKMGLKKGDVIVTEGMFLLKSLLLKSQIGDDD